MCLHHVIRTCIVLSLYNSHRDTYCYFRIGSILRDDVRLSVTNDRDAVHTQLKPFNAGSGKLLASILILYKSTHIDRSSSGLKYTIRYDRWRKKNKRINVYIVFLIWKHVSEKKTNASSSAIPQRRSDLC